MQTRIGDLRRARGMRQSELAEAVGVSASAIGMYEQGRREPDLHMLLKLARLFDVSVDYLIGASDRPERFDVNEIAACVARDLMNQPALMFNAECYTEEELADIRDVIEASLRSAIRDKLEQPD